MVRQFHSSTVIVIFLLCVAAVAGDATTVEIKPDKETGVYAPGETVTWTIEIATDKKLAAGKASYRVLLGGLDEIGKGDVTLAEGKATVAAHGRTRVCCCCN